MSWIEVVDGQAYWRGFLLPIPGFKLAESLGEGAHARVFKAHDTTLQRLVAVKVWKRRIGNPSSSRALAEVQKLAALPSPLMVTVYHFASLDGVAYAVMELVPGVSMKSWLQAELRPLQDRCAVWSLYVRALDHLYEHGTVHGDPHWGNVLVFEDKLGIYRRLVNYNTTPWPKPLGLKLADVGTSRLWASQESLTLRETSVIAETAGRLFSDLQTSDLLALPLGKHPRIVLPILEQLGRYASALTLAAALTGPEGYRQNLRWDNIRHAIASALGRAPFFRLEVVRRQLEDRSMPTAEIADTFRLANDQFRRHVHVVLPSLVHPGVGGRPARVPLVAGELESIQLRCDAARGCFVSDLDDDEELEHPRGEW